MQYGRQPSVVTYHYLLEHYIYIQCYTPLGRVTLRGLRHSDVQVFLSRTKWPHDYNVVRQSPKGAQ